MLVAETERDALAALDEDAAIELHARVQRARNKYRGQYRRAGSARVPAKGARGAARPANQRAALKVEAFEEALARVSRRVATLAREAAAQLKRERLDAARSTPSPRPRRSPAPEVASGRSTRDGSRKGDRSLRSPASEKNRAGTQAKGQRRQA